VSGCIFCKIAEGQIPAKLVLEDDDLLAFHDVAPQAPVHVLLVPRRHVASLDELQATDETLLGRMMLAIPEIARKLGVAGAYRVVTNCGAEAGQSVFHLHLHLLGGRRLGWPPG
jgi:histidine triad (HIT) family protein